MVNAAIGMLGLGHIYVDSAKNEINELHRLLLGTLQFYTHTHIHTQILLLIHTCMWLCKLNSTDYIVSFPALTMHVRKGSGTESWFGKLSDHVIIYIKIM